MLNKLKIILHESKYYSFDILTYLLLMLSILLSDYNYNFLFCTLMICVVYVLLSFIDKIFYLLFFLYPFDNSFVITELKGFDVFNFLMCLCLMITSIKYLIKVIKKEEKINIYIATILLIILLYMVMPIFPFNMSNTIKYLFIMIAIFIAFSIRQNIKFSLLVRSGAMGIVLSCFMAIMLNSNGRIMMGMSHYYEQSYEKFCGLFWNPNCLAIYSIIILSSLFVLLYNNRRSIIDLALIFSIFIFGYNTISRNYVLSFAAIYILFIIISLIIKNRYAFFKGIFIGGILCVLILCMFTQTELYIDRIKNSQDIILTENVETNEDEHAMENDNEDEHAMENDNEDEHMMENDNEDEFEDPGRIKLWGKYIKSIIDSKKSILFGYGISKPWLGQTPAHNGYIQVVWNFGIIGTSLLIVLMIIILRKGKNKAGAANIIIPFAILSIFENTIFNVWTLWVIILLITLEERDKKGNKNDTKNYSLCVGRR